ncbi:hypothetical protein SS209_01386 [Salmonella enterica subsp. enterica serovar Senftenberg str. SS209]|nr:hypothetical protein SS209_01386 [Salmonella enterica subsp. enterica serovar Senftenberg str. SS209]
MMRNITITTSDKFVSNRTTINAWLTSHSKL